MRIDVKSVWWCLCGCTPPGCYHIPEGFDCLCAPWESERHPNDGQGLEHPVAVVGDTVYWWWCFHNASKAEVLVEELPITAQQYISMYILQTTVK